jgi:hypothetical protein
MLKITGKRTDGGGYRLVNALIAKFYCHSVRLAMNPNTRRAI